MSHISYTELLRYIPKLTFKFYFIYIYREELPCCGTRIAFSVIAFDIYLFIYPDLLHFRISIEVDMATST